MTKSFNFSLQKVLNVREMVEDTKAVELKKAQAIIDHENQKLDQTRAEKNALLKKGSEPDTQETMSLQHLNNRTAYADQLTDKIEEQREVIEKSKQDAEEHRLAFVKASRDKMVIEKLKEHHKDAFRKKMNQEQVKVESEVAARISSKSGDA